MQDDDEAELLALQAEIQREELEILALKELKAERDKEASPWFMFKIR